MMASPPTGLHAPLPGTRREWGLLAGVLLLAGALRLLWPGLTEFKQDEAHLYALALDLAEFKALPLRGISNSVGLPNAPMSVYLFALPLFVWRSPLAATLFVGLLNTAAVALAYSVGRRYWGAPAALAAALLYAAAPWAVIYARKIWAQELLPPFVLGYVAAALLAFVEGRRRWVLVHLLLLAVVVQIHISAAALGLLTLVLLIIYRRRVSWRYVGYGLAAALLTLAPLGVFALRQAGEVAAQFGDLAALLARPSTISPEALTLAGMVIAGMQVRGLAGPEAFRAFEATVPDFTPLLWLGGALCAAGAAHAVWQFARRRAPSVARSPAAEAGLIVTLWLALPVLFFVRHSTPVYAHYFILLFPAPYLLAGAAVAAAAARWRAVWLAPLAVAAAQTWLVLALLHFVGTHATPGAFGPPLRALLETAALARALGRAEIVVVADGADPGVDLAPAVFDVLLRDWPHRLVDGRTTAVLPAGEAAVIVWPAAAGYGWPVAALYQAWGGGQWAHTVPQRLGEGELLIAARAGAALPVPQPRAASALLANGVEVLGHAAAPEGWQLWWTAPGPQDGPSLVAFAHLYAGAQRVAQVDAATYAVADWRPGDQVISFFPLPRTGEVVRAGFYTYPALDPVPVLDALGQPAGEWLEFPRD